MEDLAAQIAAIYEAALQPDGWTGVISNLRSTFGLTFATMATYSADRRRVQARAVGIAQDDYQSFLDKYFRTNEFSTETEQRVAGSIVPSRSFIDPAVFQRSDMYQDFHRARDMGEGLRLDIWREADMYQSIAFFRPWRQGPYAPAELAACAHLMPHLRRAATLSGRLHQADLIGAAAFEALDRLPQAVMLLDACGRVAHANRAAESLLGSGDSFAVAHGVPRAANTAYDAALATAIARARGCHGAMPVATTLRLPKRTGGAPLAVLVAPFSRQTHWTLPNAPRVLVCATDPDAAHALSARQLIDLFGLTDAEVVLANDLAAGRDVQEIAERRGRSVNTVRSHLARLMAKTHVNRQSKLMRLLVNLPVR